MHIIIPMSGKGKRFINAGYSIPKPLILVDGKPMIEHVVNLFPTETKFTFICNEEHVARTNVLQILKRIAPLGTIVTIPYQALGPVNAVLYALSLIDDNEETIVNYCDFGTHWDYHNFLQTMRMQNADGGIPAYRGFHPHMLGSTNYAFIKESGKQFEAIQEKKPFTENRLNEYASNGTYYFKKGSFIKKYFPLLIEKNINTNEEFYVSMIYNLMHADGLNTVVYEIEHMLQWGTPEDLAHYDYWSSCFTALASQKKDLPIQQRKGTTIIPMAGKGSRFATEGYSTPKPLLPINKKPMVIEAAQSLLPTITYTFICLDEHLKKYDLPKNISQEFNQEKISFIPIHEVTQGQACTSEKALPFIENDEEIFVVACDNGMMLNKEELSKFIDREKPDVIVFSFRHNPTTQQNPYAYSYVALSKGNVIKNISEKKPISSNPLNDHTVVGAFYFKSKAVFQQCLEALYLNNHRINGEFYLDSCINEAISLDFKVLVYEIDYYLSWGTPNDYQTFLYWQNFFHKCWWHPYQKNSVAQQVSQRYDYEQP